MQPRVAGSTANYYDAVSVYSNTPMPSLKRPDGSEVDIVSYLLSSTGEKPSPESILSSQEDCNESSSKKILSGKEEIKLFKSMGLNRGGPRRWRPLLPPRDERSADLARDCALAVLQCALFSPVDSASWGRRLGDGNANLN